MTVVDHGEAPKPRRFTLFTEPHLCFILQARFWPAVSVLKGRKMGAAALGLLGIAWLVGNSGF